METRELTCIGCPLGCALRVELNDAGEVVSVSGNTCKRGEEYGRREVTAPVRMVTSTVRVTGGKAAVVPVRTATDIPKGKIFDCMDEIRNAVVAAPVEIGDVVIENVAGTGVSIVASKAVEREDGE
ncbi:DUF1667 domain-containing protein [uncultured Neglectibacter sp.]|uniref:DUF1667 domain-containing protein n=1 Tax=uncultured Neglectibacter sp. TaxID=1924108 RepID=UPI0034DEA850